MRALKEYGLIVPSDVPTDDDAVPLDFTTLSNKEIGSLHSRYAVRHAYAIFKTAEASTKLVHLKRDLRIAQARFRVQNSDEKKNIVDAMMEEDDHIAHLLNRISVMEARVQLLDAVTHGYEDLRNAASREISRRIGEKAAVHDA